MKTKFFGVIALTVFLFAGFGCQNKTNYVPVEPQRLKGYGKIYFVPISNFPLTEVEQLSFYYKNKYGITIETLPSMKLESFVEDIDREQLIAEALINSMKKNYAQLVSDPQTILIGLTTEDIYIAKTNWRFTFSYREDGRFAVVSNARMKLGASFNPEKLNSRLRKMVTKNIGIMYYRLQQSDNPQSVLYKGVGGTQELDYMGEEF